MASRSAFIPRVALGGMDCCLLPIFVHEDPVIYKQKDLGMPLFMDKKSQENIAAADKLIQAGYCNASIHCSYYAVFQFMKYTLDTKGLCPYKEQDESQGKSSHEAILSKLSDNWCSCSKEERKQFKNTFWLLKKARVEADYKVSKTFNEQEAEDMVAYAKSLIGTLQTVYNL